MAKAYGSGFRSMSASTSTTEHESNNQHFPLFTANGSVTVAIRKGPPNESMPKAPSASGPLKKVNSRKTVWH